MVNSAKVAKISNSGLQLDGSGRFCFCLIIFMSWWQSAKAESPEILAIGEQKTIEVSAETRFSVGNPEVVQVKSTSITGGKTLLLVKGKSQGFSDLILLEKNATRHSVAFRVVSKREAALSGDARVLLPRISGLHSQNLGATVVVSGTVQSISDWNQLQKFVDDSKGRILNQANLHPLTRLKMEVELRKLFQKAGIAGVEVKGAGNVLVLRGSLGSLKDKAFAEQLAREKFPSILSQLEAPFELGASLKFSAKILEVNRKGAQALGFDWTDEIPGALQVQRKFLKSPLGLEANFKFLETEGQAKTLAQPQLMVNEKGIAELKAGGEFPVPYSNKSQAGFAWKAYGLRLRLELLGQANEKVRTKIQVELSSPDPTLARDGVPGVRSNTMESEINLKTGEPIVLSGLSEVFRGSAEKRIPLLGSIPILGALFTSSEFQERKSDLVILLRAEDPSALLGKNPE